MDGSVLEKKSSFNILGFYFSFKLNWGSYIISIAKAASKKIGALILSMKLLPEFALYLYKFTILSFMEYNCHIWAGAPSCYLELLDKLQKWICRTVGPLFASSLEPLAHCPFNSRFFLNKFFVCFNHFLLLFLVTPCLVMAIQSCMK